MSKDNDLNIFLFRYQTAENNLTQAIPSEIEQMTNLVVFDIRESMFVL